MRSSSTNVVALGVRLAVALVVTASSARGQGSWLPFGNAVTGAYEISVSPGGAVWTIGKEPGSILTILRVGENTFVSPPGTPSRVGADPNGFAWVANTKGDLFHWVRSASGKEDWVQSSQKAIDVAVSVNGSVWVIAPDHHVVHLQGDNWQDIGGSGEKIAVDPSGNPWVVDSNGSVSQYADSKWTSFGGNARDITVAPDGSVFILGTHAVQGGYEVLRLSGASWQHIIGGGGVAIAAGPGGVYVARTAPAQMVFSSTYIRLRVGDQPPTDAATITEVPQQPASHPALSLDSPKSVTPASSVAAGNATNTPAAESTGGGLLGGLGKVVGGVAGAAGTAAGAAGTAVGTAAGAATSTVGAATGAASAGVGAAGVAGGAAQAKVSEAQTAAGAAMTAVGAVNTTAGAVNAAAGAAGAASGIAGSFSSLPTGISSSVSSSATTAAQAPGAQAANPPVNSAATAGPPSPTSTIKDLASAGLTAVRTLQATPIAGKLLCPDLASKAHLELGCALIGRAAMQLGPAPSTDCVAPAFSDSQNAGECWSCPNTFSRNSRSAGQSDACMKMDSSNTLPIQYSGATVVTGCSLYKSPPGYGTAFRDPRNGGECWVCPALLERAWSIVNNVAHGTFGSCLGHDNANQIVWQLTQFPEPGAYRFMPGLISIALADPIAVDAFLDKRAGGVAEVKRAMWAKMADDPAGSPELKALLFASMLNVAEKDSADALAKDALSEFESYMRARRTFLADEASRMFGRWNEVQALIAAQRAGGLAALGKELAGSAIADFKSYAWSSAAPDSAGTAFVLAAASLSQLDATRGGGTSLDSALASLHVDQLKPITNALEKGLEFLQGTSDNIASASGTLTKLTAAGTAVKTAQAGMIGATLLSGAMSLGKTAMALLHKDEVAGEYEKFKSEMSAPVTVRELLKSDDPKNQETLLLLWALATSPHKASETLGSGAMTTGELCSSDGWTAATCASAKAMVAAAAHAAGY